MPAWFYNLHVVTALFLIYAVFGTIGFIAYKLNKKYLMELFLSIEKFFLYLHTI